MQFDLVIRNGTIIDGTGASSFVGDVGIKGDRIAAVATGLPAGAEEIDATGLVVTPGFIDLHTHYDGQAIWSSRINPSSAHGVTTVIMGNCGVGFAPCRPKHRQLLCDTMEGVEDIPGAVMAEGLPWNWESFPQYLDAVAAVPHDIDIGVLVPHSPVRVHVMGERGANHEVASADNLNEMRRLVAEGVSAGALGFGSSRTAIDRRKDGVRIASFDAAVEELIACAQGVKDAGGGLFQILPELGMTGLSAEAEFDLMARVSDATGLPITFTVMEGRRYPGHGLRLLELSQAHNAGGGAPIHPQYLPRPLGLMASFDLTSNPFVHCAGYQEIAHLPLEQRVIELRKPELKQRILHEEAAVALQPLTALTRQFDLMYELGEVPCYEPEKGSSVAARAKAMGRTPEDLAYDLLLEDEGHKMMLVAASNFVDESLDSVIPFFNEPEAVIGLGDGGAHYGLVSDASYPTYVLTHWARDRKGWRVSLEQAVQGMSGTPARVLGMSDRGIIARGKKADINIIDMAGLRLFAPFVADDLPAGGRRLDQKASGYVATIVSGTIIQRHDTPTGAWPGRLVRRGA